MLKKYGFLFGSLAVLVTGLVCLVASGMTYPTIILLSMGVICTISSMFVSLPYPHEKEPSEPSQPAQRAAQKDSSQLEANAKPVVLPSRKHKIVCKYCKNRFPCTLDNCPHCGAPVDVSSLSPECMEVVPHASKVTSAKSSTKTKSRNK